MKKIFLVLLIVFVSKITYAQKAGLPIIDMHLHCYPADWDRNNTPFNPATGLQSRAVTGNDLLPETLLEMDKHNIVLGFLSGSLENVMEWKNKAPERFVVGPQLPRAQKGAFESIEYWPSPKNVRDAIKNGQIGVIGEITTQYAGMLPGDTLLNPYYTLAEEFDMPVGIHTGNGTIAIIGLEERKKYRVDYGNPLHVNEVIARYPHLRIYLSHAGYPFLDDAIAIMKVYNHVYADLSRINWHSATRVAFHNYLKSLIDAGLGDRLMFGSDGAGLPEAIGLAVEGINSAEFLSEKQKRDILYNNAARFLRLSEEQIAEHHEN